VPGLSHIIYDDPRGLRNYASRPDQRAGPDGGGPPLRAAAPGLLRAGDRAHQPDDTAIILYTSGTTGKPKGVCQTHRAFIAAAEGGVAIDRLNGQDNVLSYLPPAWVGDHLFSVAQWLVAGFTINCPESAETVAIDLREIGPTYYFAPPRVFEGMLTSVSIRMEDAARVKQWMHEPSWRGAPRGRRHPGRQAGGVRRSPVRPGQCAGLRAAEERLGLSRIRVAYTAARPSGPTCSASSAPSASTSSSSTARPRPAPTCACSRTARSSSTPWARPRRAWS
jgi:long-chain acyl-CoA synthetase